MTARSGDSRSDYLTSTPINIRFGGRMFPTVTRMCSVLIFCS